MLKNKATRMKSLIVLTTCARMSFVFFSISIAHSRLFLFFNMSLARNRQSPPPEQLWKSWDRKARKQGLHATIYSADGSQYKGDWLKDKRHGEIIEKRQEIRTKFTFRIE